jgi:hypothetical protein
LNELLSDRLIEILIANSSKLLFVQEVLYGDLQGLNYDLGDRYTLTPKIKEGYSRQSRCTMVVARLSVGVGTHVMGC